MGWRFQRIRDNFVAINGFPFPSEGFNNENVGRPIVRIRDILSDDLPTYFDGEMGTDVVVSDRDIVIGMDGDFNSAWWNKGTALLNQRVLALREKHNASVIGRFAFFQLPIALQIINDLTPWSTVKHLASSDVLDLRIPTPDLETQKSIADFLDRETARIDQLIEKKQLQIRLISEKQRAFATEAVIGKKGHSLVDSGIDVLPLVPAHWRIQRIASIFRESSEMGGSDLPVLSVSINWGISDRELQDEDRHRIVTHIENRDSYKRVRPGDLVYNMMRAWQGAFGVARVDGLVSPAYVVARPSEKIHAPYFEHLLRTPMWIEEFRRASKGIADFRQRLYWEHFRQVKILLPPHGEQLEIADRIVRHELSIGSLIDPIVKSIDRLKEYRSAMITAAVTGQIDVSTWGKQGQTDHDLDQLEEKASLREAHA